MDLARRDEYKQQLFELTPADGKGVTNASVREQLKAAFPDENFTLDDYWDLRQALITDGKLEPGRGYGGSVHRVLPAAAPPQEPQAAAPAAVPEAALYEPFQKCLQNGYVPANDLKPWTSEITAFQGRRDTGGRWTRPDVTLIAMKTFTYVPHKVFEVITFEIKPNIDTALDGVFEAAAHSAFAHRSYLAFPESKDYETSPLYERISTECERLGLGLILFSDVANWDTYLFQVTAKVRQPEPQALNDFIKTQISEKNREEIQRWFR
jgi:hypothetical protein